MKLFHKVLVKIYYGGRNISENTFKILIIALIKTPLFQKNSIVISHNSQVKIDGLGAQIQRIFGCANIAQFLGVGYSRSDFRDVTVHPLDDLSEFDNYESYISFLNNLMTHKENYKLDSSYFYYQKEKNSISLFYIFVTIAKTILLKRKYLLHIVEPYIASDYLTEYYPDTIKHFTHLLRYMHFHTNNKEYKPTVVIHYRYGVGGFTIYPGQKIPREINENYFIDAIEHLISGDAIREYQYIIVTDAPKVRKLFLPNADQKAQWKGTPKYSGDSIEIEPHQFKTSKSKLPNLEIIYGGNPLNAIRVMAQADILLIGRSSLSYIAGILNTNGIVIFPQDFWHNPLPGWIIYEKKILKTYE